MPTITLQAEQAELQGAIVASTQGGSQGGYVDYLNDTGGAITWRIDAGQAEAATLSWRYALGVTVPRSLRLEVNGVVDETLSFGSSGTWTSWTTRSATVDLLAGSNTIRLITIGGNGPNIDLMTATASSLDAEFRVRINFQPAGAPIPSGYVADTGASFTASRGFGWITEASVGASTRTPLDLSAQARDRNAAGVTQRLDTFVHMEAAGAQAGAWEHVVPNGSYAVTVSVGEFGFFDSAHRIRAEGVQILPSFTGNASQPFALATGIVTVADGRLTIDSIGGTNTKIASIEFVAVDPADQPRIVNPSIANRATDVSATAAMIANVDLVDTGVLASSLGGGAVTLVRTRDGAPVAGAINTSGGGDTIVFTPSAPLSANTQYSFVIDGVTDTAGREFIPFATSFVTGASTGSGGSVGFAAQTVASGLPITSLALSPDNTKLFACTIDGRIVRWDVDAATGSLGNQQTWSGLTGRSIIGLAFDPNNPTDLWVSHNAPYTGLAADDFTGRISILHLGTGTNLSATAETYVTGLPRSVRDHLTNSLDFGPDGRLYVTQGSNSAMGAPDTTWGNRPERLLSASVLQIDPDRTPPAGGFNVQTQNYTDSQGVFRPGNYDPFAANAVVQIYGEGVRNAYDLVWHSNGSLYVPTNGSAAGGNTPDNPATSQNEALTNVAGRNDYLFKVVDGGFYGHPNPLLGHFILNGGNPSSGTDPGEVLGAGTSGYPVGTRPDPDWRGAAFDFGLSRSPNGVAEYLSTAFNSALRNDLLVVRYSAGDDLLALDIDAAGNVVGSRSIASGFNNPLDLAVHASSGRIYVAQFGSEASLTDDVLTVLRPTTSGGTVRHEAENASRSGPVVTTEFSGFSGSGYVDYRNATNDWVQWTVSVAQAGQHRLEFGYALGGTGNRPLALSVDGTVVNASLAFNATGSWTTWREAVVDLSLGAGTHTVRLTATGSSGPNLDYLDFA